MRKLVVTAAILTAIVKGNAQQVFALSNPVTKASVVAKEEQKVYVGVKCPVCPTDSEKKVVYKAFPQTHTETLEIGEETYTMDWGKKEMVQDGDILPIHKIEILADTPSVKIVFGNHLLSELTIIYDGNGKFKDYSLKPYTKK